jgi:hypothetical protein
VFTEDFVLWAQDFLFIEVIAKVKFVPLNRPRRTSGSGLKSGGDRGEKEHKVGTGFNCIPMKWNMYWVLFEFRRKMFTNTTP